MYHVHGFTLTWLMHIIHWKRILVIHLKGLHFLLAEMIETTKQNTLSGDVACPLRSKILHEVIRRLCDDKLSVRSLWSTFKWWWQTNVTHPWTKSYGEVYFISLWSRHAPIKYELIAMLIFTCMPLHIECVPVSRHWTTSHSLDGCPKINLYQGSSTSYIQYIGTERLYCFGTDI